MKVAIAQIRCNWSNPISKNLQKVIGFIEKAGRSGAEIVCFSEYFLGKDAILGHPKKGEDTEAALKRIGEKAKESDIAVICGATREIRRGQRKPVVTCSIINAKGEIVKKVDKVVPYIRERDLIQPGDGPDVAEINGFNIGVLAGLDIFFSPAIQKLKEKDVDLVFYQLAASTRSFLETEQAAAVARCQELMIPIVAVGQLGEYSKAPSLGGSLVCVPNIIKISSIQSQGGVKIIKKLGKEERIDVVDLALDDLKQQRKRINFLT
ncbi:MAG: carbon-nitrogen hydrolase family protein [Thermoproteota archaeon]